MTASDSEIIVVIFLHPAGCAVRASQRSSPCQSVGQRLAGATASPRLCARLVHSMVSVGPRFAYDSQEPVSLCVTLHRASLCSLTLRLQLTSVPCAHVINPVVSVGQRLAGACSSAYLCSSFPLVGLAGPRFTGQDICISAPCGQRLAGACSSASLCSSCALLVHSLVSVGPRFTGASISASPHLVRLKDPPHRRTAPTSKLSRVVRQAVSTFKRFQARSDTNQDSRCPIAHPLLPRQPRALARYHAGSAQRSPQQAS